MIGVKLMSAANSVFSTESLLNEERISKTVRTLKEMKVIDCLPVYVNMLVLAK